MKNWINLIAGLILGYSLAHSVECHSFELVPKDWDDIDSALFAANIVTRVIDAGQTAEIKDYDNIEEDDPLGKRLMGRNPSEAEVVAYFVGMLGVDYAISYVLPSTWRKAYLTGRVGLSLKTINDNYELGLRWGF